MTEGEEDVKTREQILSDAEGEADHKGKQTQLQTVNNALIRNQTQQQVRLEEELEELRGSLETYATWSRALTIVLIVLGGLSLVVQGLFIAVRLGIL
jgi:hypothetical protein